MKNFTVASMERQNNFEWKIYYFRQTVSFYLTANKRHGSIPWVSALSNDNCLVWNLLLMVMVMVMRLRRIGGLRLIPRRRRGCRHHWGLTIGRWRRRIGRVRRPHASYWLWWVLLLLHLLILLWRRLSIIWLLRLHLRLLTRISGGLGTGIWFVLILGRWILETFRSCKNYMVKGAIWLESNLIKYTVLWNLLIYAYYEP